MKSTNGCPKPNTDKTSEEPKPVELPAWLTRHRAKVAILTSGAPVVDDYRDTPIDYLDVAPRPITVQIPFLEYFERIKRLKADPWQVHFCNYLQTAVENRHIKGTLAEFHAESRLGKTVILSQAFPAWCFGHDPLWRHILAMYNQTRSETHSDVILAIMRGKAHRDIFPNPDGHLPTIASKSGWSTNARLDVESGRADGQKSFTPTGLHSGITGVDADWWNIDDPYKEPAEAFSEAIRTAMQRFWEYGIVPRLNTHSCIAAMFHRYTVDDLGGLLLDTAKFDYVRYASEADGDYIHDETGQRFQDPLDRKPGELISPRRPESYYTDKRKDRKVWLSMFQGRPTSEEGEFFKVGKITYITEPADVQRAMQECVIVLRAWDHAATEAAGDWSVGAKLGMRSDGSVVVFDVVMEQIDTAKRVALQRSTAIADGPDVIVVIPKELAAAGKDVVFFTTDYLQGFTVVARSVINAAPGSTAKARRAYNFSVAVNSSQVEFVEGDWNKGVVRCLRNFLASTFDDPVDALSDGYNEAFERISKGLVIKNYTPQQNLVGWHNFAARFADNGTPLTKVPERWTTYVGVKLTPDASLPNSAVLVAQASQNTNLEDTLFVIAEYKEYTADLDAAFDWIDAALEAYCTNSEDALIWLHPESEQYKNTIWQKLQRAVAIFEGGDTAGLSELDWYLLPRPNPSPFNASAKASGLYGVVADPKQLSVATDEFGLYSLRQEFATWALNDKGEPNAIGAVADCLRMVAYGFRTTAGDLTKAEKIERALPVAIRAETLAEIKDPAELDRRLQRRMIELEKEAKAVDTPMRGPRRFGRR